MNKYLLLVLIFVLTLANATAATLRTVRAFRALPVEKACVVNSVLFEAFLRREAPNAWTARVTIPAADTEGEGHEVVAFDLGSGLYVWDPKFGAVSIRANKADIADVGRAAFAALNSGRAARPVEMLPITGSAAYAALEQFHEFGHEAELVRYAGREFVIFVTDGNLLNAFSPDFGTIRGRIQVGFTAHQALRDVFAKVLNGRGDFSILAGSIASTTVASR